MYALALASLLLVCTGCGDKPAEAAKNGGGGGKGPGAMAPPPVRVARAEARTVPVEIDTFGTVEPLATVQVRAQVSGELQKIWFQEGEVVKTGQELFTIDPRPYEVALAQAEASLARARAEVARAQSNAEENQAQARNAQTEFDRNRTLLEKGMVTQEEADQSRAMAEASRAAVKSSQAAITSSEQDIRAAQAAIDAAKLSLGYTLIKSPMDGRTGSLMAHQGDLIRPNDTAPMVVITQMQPLYVSFTLPEKHLPEVRRRFSEKELPTEARLPDQGEALATGRLTFIDSSVDPNTSTIRLKATFENQQEELWPGQYVQVTLTLGSLPDAVMVPSQAVQTGQHGSYVYVISAESTAELRPVKAGPQIGESVVVEEGLKAGETVVTEGHLRVAPKMPVRILDAGEAAPAQGAT